MEPKVIFYIIVGILYFLYSVGKKKEEQQKKRTSEPRPGKPVSTPDPLQDILREMKRMQTGQATKKYSSQQPATPQRTLQPTAGKAVDKGNDVLLHERKVMSNVEGRPTEITVYERELTPEEKNLSGRIELANEGVYKIETIEEVEARETAESVSDYQFNPREAIIGSIILERKY